MANEVALWPGQLAFRSEIQRSRTTRRRPGSLKWGGLRNPEFHSEFRKDEWVELLFLR
jgi:hypothetical protein